jgi:hypothetical protein
VIIKQNNNYSKNITKKLRKEIKSKLLSFHLVNDNNLTERLKTEQTEIKPTKIDKDNSHSKSIVTPQNNMKKRTKTEILDMKNDIFPFGQPSEINSYNYKSINRQILRNINSTNVNRPHKEISLINKKIINYHFGINSSKKEKKFTKHTSANSQNLTGIKIISIANPLPLKEIIKKKTGIFPYNKTERTSRNHSKDKINKNNTVIRRNHLDSFSPKKTQEFIYKKMKKIHNKNSAIIGSFFKSVNSKKKINSSKIDKKNYSTNNYSNYKGINFIKDSKDLFNRSSRDKNF